MNTRVKDLVDMVAIAAIDRVNADILTSSVRATFEARATHPIPSELADAPTAWRAAYARLADDSPTAPTVDLGAAVALARKFWDPLLAGAVPGLGWDPTAGDWK